MNRGCHCLPIWLQRSSEDQSCTFCNLPFADDQAKMCCSWLYPCMSNKGRVHSIGIILHSECTTAYQKEMTESGRDKFVLYYPSRVENIPPEFAKTALVKFKFAGSWCANCKVARFKGIPFYQCVSCRSVTPEQKCAVIRDATVALFRHISSTFLLPSVQ